MALYDSMGRGTAETPAVVLFSPRKGLVSAVVACCAVLADIGTIVLGSLASAAGYVWLSGGYVDFARSQQSALVLAALFVFACLGDGSYRVGALSVPRLPGLAAKWFVSLGLFLVIAFLFKSGTYYSRAVMLGLLPIGLVGLASSRIVIGVIVKRALERHALPPTRVAVIGEVGDSEGRLRDRLNTQPLVDMANYVTVEAGDDLRSKARDVVALSQAGRIDQILIALPWSRMDDIRSLMTELRSQALPVLLMPDLGSLQFISRPAELGDLPVFDVKRAALSQSDLLMKRGLDLMVASTALVVLSPLLLAAAVAIKLDSPGPVLFRQRRNGFNNREFRVFKFRSMTVTEDGSEIRQATRNDPRVTRIGAFLRRSSIDELPQLFNVIRGEMSIVGPRPHAIAHNEEWVKLVEGYAQRHNILPGITGLAQVKGYRGQTDTPEKIDGRVKLDIAYIEQWSLGLDIRIILMTAAVLFFQKSAF